MSGSENGLILLYKPAGITSFEALHTVKKALSTKKVGHTGTLDRFAEGLLIVLSGKMTKLAPFFLELPKTYSAVIRLGRETDTLDPEGEVIATSSTIPTRAHIEECLPRFLGKIKQRPPHYSAVHIDGKRAYERIRGGEEFEMREREVTVSSLIITDYNEQTVTIRTVCSKGTYIRSLARDIALSCGSRGYLERLKRTRVGEYRAADGVRPDEFMPQRDLATGKSVFTGLSGHIRTTDIDNQYIDEIRYGKPITEQFFTSAPQLDGPYALFDRQGTFIALVEKNRNNYSYKFVGCAL